VVLKGGGEWINIENKVSCATFLVAIFITLNRRGLRSD